jgi:ABC transporter, permease protein
MKLFKTRKRASSRMVGSGVGVKRSVVTVFMIFLVAFTALPLIYIVNAAFKPLDELFLFPPTFFVKHPTGKNFRDLVISLGSSTVPFLRYVFNSVFVSLCVVVGTVIISSTAAFALSKLELPFKAFWFNLIISALMFSNHVTTIPRYLVIESMGLYNSYTALILPQIAVAYNVFLMKQFLDQYPDQIMEAAHIDGAGDFLTFIKIVFPGQKPVVATMVVLTFVSCWNDFFSPLVYTSSQTMKTLPLALQTISGGAGASSVSRAGAVSAASLLMILPVIIIFTLMQGKVMETMTQSGIKG